MTGANRPDEVLLLVDMANLRAHIEGGAGVRMLQAHGDRRLVKMKILEIEGVCDELPGTGHLVMGPVVDDSI